MAVGIERVRIVISQLTLEEKIALCGTSGSLFTRAVSRLKIEGVRLPYELAFQDETFFPLGCTFDSELVAQFGKARAMVALQKGEALGGVINLGIMRSPFSAGSERMFSEDEAVVSRLARAYIEASPLKLLASGILGGEYKFTSRWIEPRAMCELYLRPMYKLGKKLGGAVLPAGTLNGEHISESKRFVMKISDLISEHALMLCEAASINNRVVSAAVGVPFMVLDNATENNALLTAVKTGKVSEARIDKCLEKLLMLVGEYNEIKKNVPQFSVQADITQKLAQQSAVLLKNEGVLPTAQQVYTGGDITRAETEALGIGAKLLKGVKFAEAKGKPLLLLLTCNEQGAFDDSHFKLAKAAHESGAHVVLALFAPHFNDIKHLEGLAKSIFYLPVANDFTLESLGKLMRGELNPCGKLPATWAYSLSDYPAHRYTKADDRGMFCYESVMNGYRFFKSFNRPVLYPFGHGLSYTRFEISKVSVKADDKILLADFVVKNVGFLSGATVVYAFVQVPGNNIFGLKYRLAGFERVSLEKGENIAVKIEVDLKDLAAFDYKAEEWLIPGGKYKIFIGFSADEIVYREEVKVAKSTRYNLGFDSKFIPSYFADDDFNPLGADVEKVMSVPLIAKPNDSERRCLPEVQNQKLILSVKKKLSKLVGADIELQAVKDISSHFLYKILNS